MREILFRGKRIDNGEWVYGYYARKGADKESFRHYICVSTFSSDYGSNYTYPFYLYDYEVDPSTVGQCVSGLTDKNGKKIFEGDIVVVPLSGKPAKGIVEYFKTDICGFVVITQPQYSNYVLQKNYTYEVIGNIHDNPELLDNSELLEDKL